MGCWGWEVGEVGSGEGGDLERWELRELGGRVGGGVVGRWGGREVYCRGGGGGLWEVEIRGLGV